MDAKTREKRIVRAGVIGVAANVLLASFKAFVGFLSHSIAIILDAVNNLSDVLSSVVSIIGTKIAGRPADRKHPLGHGRVEYVTAALVAGVILYAGVTSLVEAIKKIIHPMKPEYFPVTFIVVGVAVVVKIVLGRFVFSEGKKLNSDALKNSGKDALLDAAIALSTIVAAVVFVTTGVSLEAWLGLLISAVIIRAGIQMILETFSKILGERVDHEISAAVKASVCETEGVMGAFDLVLNSYGPGRWLGSVNIEVPDTWNADRIDQVSREIAHRVATENKVYLTAIGIYSFNTTSDEAKAIRSRVTEAVMARDYVLQIHGFYCDTEQKKIRFDMVIDFLAPDVSEVYRGAVAEVERLYPEYEVTVHADRDYSD